MHSSICNNKNCVSMGLHLGIWQVKFCCWILLSYPQWGHSSQLPFQGTFLNLCLYLEQVSVHNQKQFTIDKFQFRPSFSLNRLKPISNSQQVLNFHPCIVVISHPLTTLSTCIFGASFTHLNLLSIVQCFSH